MTVAAVPWARHDAGHTRAFDDQVAWLVRHTSKTAMVNFLISWDAEFPGPMYSFGGVVTMHGSADCEWGWWPITDGTETMYLLDSLHYDDGYDSLFGSGYLGDGPRQRVRVRSNGYGFFTTHPDAWLGDGG